MNLVNPPSPFHPGRTSLCNSAESGKTPYVLHKLPKNVSLLCNYYDTAWGYHGGNSELVMGRILKNYPRDSFYLATKFPGYDLSNTPLSKFSNSCTSIII